MKPIEADAAYRLGHDALGQVFTCFGHLLLRHAERTGRHRLAFVARDGDLLMHVAQRLIVLTGMTKRTACTYVHLSRQATFLPALRFIDAASIEKARGVRTGNGSLAKALAYLGLPLASIAPVLDLLDIDPHAPDISPDAVNRLLADERFRQTVHEEYERQRALLAAYLVQEHIGTDATTLLVDIGWRGTILTNLRSACSDQTDFHLPAGAFLGLWSEHSPPTELPMEAIGLLADMRRSRNIFESAAWFAAFLLEAVCRADEGTTLTYESRGGRIVPIMASDSASRRAERQATPVVKEIRRGVMDYIETHGSDARWSGESDELLRRRARRSLLRLACFPTAAEVAVGTLLVHTEGQAPDWWAYLIYPRKTVSPRTWLAGLASPWRTGYIRHTGGPVLATAHLLLESALLVIPAEFRLSLARLARRVAGGADRP